MMDRVLAFSILLGCAVAAPHDLTDGTFTSTQVARGYMLKNGPIQMAHAYNKFERNMPADVKAASDKAIAKLAASGSSSRLFVRDVAAVSEDDYDTLYLSLVTVGSSAMQLIFDTGSSNLWVFSNLLPPSQQKGQHLYNPSVSGKLIPGNWSITYGDGSAGSGQVFADKVAVGEVTATAQAVEAATSASSLFLQDTASDGVLGLAASALNSVRPTKQQTFLDTTKIKLFTANLKKSSPGTYTFGFINSSLYTGPITYTPIAPTTRAQTGFWAFTMNGYSVGRGAVTTKAISAIADTGTSLAYLPQEVAAAFYNQIPGASYSSTYGGFILPCNAAPSTLNFQVNGVLQTVPGSYLVYGPVDYNGNCFGGLQSSDGMPFNVVGNIVLKSQFVVFDNSTSPARIGWAKQPGVVYS